MEGPHRQGGLSPARAASPSALFFPLAAAYALFAVPASVLPMLGIAPILPGLASPAAHAHEMLFGFALLVVAGHQLGRPGPRRLAALLVLWAAARVAFLLFPASLLAAALDIAFAAGVGTQLAPRLFSSAKKLRNLALPVVLTGLAACACTAELARYFQRPALERTTLTVAVAAFSLLMLFMGGRLLAPAAAGEFHRQGRNLEARVQPRLEGALIAVLLAAVGASAFPGERALAVAGGIAMIAGGALAVVRLLRWRLWAARARPDLAAIGVGYAWVAGGLVAWGASILAGQREIAMLHAITVGGLGTLTLNVMALTRARVARADPAASVLPAWGTGLLALACAARILADFRPGMHLALLAFAACAWSAAFARLLARLIALRRRAPGPPLEYRR